MLSCRHHVIMSAISVAGHWFVSHINLSTGGKGGFQYIGLLKLKFYISFSVVFESCWFCYYRGLLQGSSRRIQELGSQCCFTRKTEEPMGGIGGETSHLHLYLFALESISDMCPMRKPIYLVKYHVSEKSQQQGPTLDS